MLKKAVSFFLSITVITMLFTSCSTKNEGTMGSGASNVPTKNLELTVWNTQGTDYIGKNVNDDVVEKWLYDKTKVKMKNIYGNDGGQWDSKLTKLVAGNNLPNILWCQSGQGPAHFKKLSDLKVLAELTPEMVKQYAPNLWAKTPEELWKDFTIDGKLIGIPFAVPVSQVEKIYPELPIDKVNLIKEKYQMYADDVTTASIWVRDDILKKIYPEAKTYDELVAILEEKQAPIGDELLDVPIKSTEDFIHLMYKIKELNLTEDGKKVYAYSYAGDGNDNWEAINYLGAEMYGYRGHNYTATWNFEKEMIEVPLIGEMVKQAAKTQNEMINEGVIDPESLAHTKDQFKTKVFNGQYAMCDFRRVGDPALMNEQLKQSGKSFRYRPLYTQIPTQKGYDAYIGEYKFEESIALLKTLKKDDVIQVLNWINEQYTPEFEDVFNWGPKEADLYSEENGTRTFKDERFTKRFIELNTSALDSSESKGLRNSGNKLYVRPSNYSGMTQDIYVGYKKYTPKTSSGFRFPIDSPHVKNVKVAPPCQAYSSEFSQIPELVKYWGAREQWEIAVKKAFAATKDEFETKWTDAMDILNGIADVNTMANKMTDIAKPFAEKIKQ